jgi:CopG family transcriptional regulator, nickel-responsive regulator
MDLERISLAIEKKLLERFDRLIRRCLVEEDTVADGGEAVASLTLVYDHTQRELSDRLVASGHHHHAKVLSTMHVHLDERMCLEVMALRGTSAELRHFGDHLIGLKGVKHGQLVMSSSSV